MRGRRRVDARGAPDVAVVEAHDVEAAVDELPQKSSFQATICVPSPMISSTVGSAGSPNVS